MTLLLMMMVMLIPPLLALVLLTVLTTFNNYNDNENVLEEIIFHKSVINFNITTKTRLTFIL